jgi:hypothetical protein
MYEARMEVTVETIEELIGCVDLELELFITDILEQAEGDDVLIVIAFSNDEDLIEVGSLRVNGERVEDELVPEFLEALEISDHDLLVALEHGMDSVDVDKLDEGRLDCPY